MIQNQEEIKEQDFSLRAFPNSLTPDLQITGSVARNNNILAIYFVLQGDLNNIHIPKIADIPKRKNELWEETCFEFFLGVNGSPSYWEFNLSPSGHWNVYKFDNYRQGMQEETAIQLLPFNIQDKPDSLQLMLELDLDQIITTEQDLDLAITTVIKDKSDKITYWALKHCGKQADFHLRDSFLIGRSGIRDWD